MEDYRDRGEPHLLARLARYGMMTGAAALVFASGMASGMFVDGTSETILAYKTQASSRQKTASRRAPMLASHVRPAVRERDQVSMQPANGMIQAAWFPANNTVHWDVSLAPGQSMSGLSIRNTHSDRNLVVVLNAIAPNGEWIRAGVINVAAGREGIVHPPTGSYAMTVLSLPTTTPYEQLDRATASETVYFDLLDPESADTQPATRFQVADGQPQRLPDLATYASRSRATDDANG